MGWKDRTPRRSSVKDIFAYAWRIIKNLRIRHFAFLLSLIVAIQALIMYTKSGLIVHPTAIPENVKKLGYNPTNLTLSAVASLPESVSDLRRAATNSVLGVPDINGHCYPSGWKNEEFLKKISLLSQPRPSSTSEFVEFKFSEGGISFFEVVDTIASLFSMEKTTITPSITEIKDDLYSLRLDVKHDGQYFRASEQQVTGAHALEDALLKDLIMISYPKEFSVTLQGQSDIDLDSLIKTIERIGSTPDDVFFLRFAKLNAMQFGGVTSADSDLRALRIAEESESLLSEMNKLNIDNKPLELRLLLNIAMTPLIFMQNWEGLSSESKAATLERVKEISERLSIFRETRNPTQADLANIFIALTFLQNPEPSKRFSTIASYLAQLDGADHELQLIAVEYAILSAASDEIESAKSILATAYNLNETDETRADIQYARKVRFAIAEMMISGSDLTEKIVDLPDFILYPCVSFGFLQDVLLILPFRNLQPNLQDIERGFYRLQSERLTGFHFYNSWGNLYAVMNNDRKAIEKYREARSFDGDTWWALLNEGNSFLKLGELENAEDLYRESLNLMVIPRAVFGLLDVLALNNDAEDYFRVLNLYESVLLQNQEYGPLFSLQAMSVACHNDMSVPDAVSLVDIFPMEIDVQTCDAPLLEGQAD
jgi:tetratricopeptide (TPR) repeat protein